MSSLVSGQNRVESPFIIVQIGKYTFGSCEKGSVGSHFNSSINVTYPNFMRSITINKVNGAINTYSISMVYGITQFDDPNLLDKVFSSVANTRKIKVSYGDWNTPNYIYRDEEALITNVQTTVNLKTSTIEYTIQCTSTSLQLKAGTNNYPAVTAKPSDLIKQMLADKSTGFSDVFRGMTDQSFINKCIASDDREVYIPAYLQKSPLEYLGILVNSMSSLSDEPNSTVRNSKYMWCVRDDINNEYGGSYFEIRKVDANYKDALNYNAYELDIGYPNASYVESFQLRNDQSWAILYDYSQDIQMQNYSRRINGNGQVQPFFSPSLTNNSMFFETTEVDRTWWTNMTQFPVSATLKIKGLLRPATLMEFVKINVYFYGNKHVSSGLYFITKQVDEIGMSGYSTTLSLTRLGGD